MSRSLAVVALARSVALTTIPTPRTNAQPAKAKGTNYAFLVGCLGVGGLQLVHRDNHS